MIPSNKAASLMQLILSSKEITGFLEQALRSGNEKKIEELKENLSDLNKNIKKILDEFKK